MLSRVASRKANRRACLKGWQAFLEICAHLRAGLFGERLVAECKAPWNAVIEVSNLQLVSPTLAWCLKDRSDLPTEVREYFEAIHALNSRREKAMLDALEPALRTLNSAGVEPILLKGAAHLIEGLYPPGARLVGDVDILIVPNLAEPATRSLVEAGYEISN